MAYVGHPDVFVEAVRMFYAYKCRLNFLEAVRRGARHVYPDGGDPDGNACHVFSRGGVPTGGAIQFFGTNCHHDKWLRDTENYVIQS